MLSWDLPPQAVGGTAAHVTGLSEALAAAGHEMVVLSIDDPRVDRDAERSGPVQILRAAHDMPWIPPTRRLAIAASANHAIVKLADRLDRAWRPDVVHGHDWTVGWAGDTLASRYDVPFVLTMHGTERVRHGGNLPVGEPADIAAIEWWLAFQADRLITPTQFIEEQLISGFELDPHRVVRIPNGIDPGHWGLGDGTVTPADDPAGGSSSSDTEREPLVVTWGRVQFEKGFQVLARALATLRHRRPEVRSVIAGRGSYLPELQTQIDVEGVSDLIDLPGFLRHDDLRALVQRAGCVVIPSLYEPFGVVALEALAAGAPLIVARTGGLAELVGGTGAALTFEPGNADDLAHCIEMVLRDDDLATSLTERARELVTGRYAWEAIAHETAQLYAAVAAAHRPA